LCRTAQNLSDYAKLKLFDFFRPTEFMWDDKKIVFRVNTPLSGGGGARLLDVVEAEAAVAGVGRATAALHAVRVHADNERFRVA
jgi:hypothetical protein